LTTVDNPLAYVFWHWPRPDVPQGSYETELLSFVRDLSSARVPGLREAFSFRVGPLPWGPERGTFYEDWYVVEDFSSLDVLANAAISGSAGKAHQAIVKDFMKGAGGVFRLVTDDIQLDGFRFVTWTDKAIGASYSSYIEEIVGLTKGGLTDIWQRQLALGPSREFCIHSTEVADMPARFGPLVSKFEPLR
jgi:hypothetical protein